MADEFELKKWYFGVNEEGLKNSYGLVTVAVRSCLANTPLKPHCVYVGKRIRLLNVLRKLGVVVIHHEPILKPELQIGYGAKYLKLAGHWLRVDLPAIETVDQYILYTDIDVLFLNWRPDLLKPPAFLAAAPESDIRERRKFNSGVMVMNLDGMRPEMPTFYDAIRKRLLGNFVYPSHDQRSFNDYFGGRHDHLDPRLNWKPYWGLNRDASIVHFHGPKPRHVRMLQAGKFRGNERLLATLARDPVAYDHYYKLWARYAPPRLLRDQGVPNRASRFHLARMLAKGNGVEQDRERARIIFEELAAKNFPGAARELRRLKLSSAVRRLLGRPS